MTYSCPDFVDSIVNALGVDIPDASSDSPSDQADICLAEISRLQVVESVLAAVRADNPEFETGAMVDHADVTARLAARWPEIVAALSGVPMVQPSELIVAIYETRHGDETRLYRNINDAIAWRREIARDNWATVMDGEKPDDDQEAADAYFKRLGDLRGEFIRVESVDIQGCPAPSPGIDWRAIAQDLAGALSSTVQQIEQMQGMFDDEDNAIAESLEDANAALDLHRKAGKIAPDAPAPAMRRVWTVTTEGDNLGIETDAFASEADAVAGARQIVRDNNWKGRDLPADLDEMGSDSLNDLFGQLFDGACIIKSHDIPA